MLRIYNDFTKKKEIFKANNKVVKIYSCGPTVYNYAHIGNLLAFIQEDLLVRYLKFKGYNVIHVRNLTDVEDKIINALNDSNKSLKEYTDFYINALFEDFKKIKTLSSSYYPRATEYINEMVDFIYDLIRKGYAYKSDDGSVYFSVSKFKNYGKLSGKSLDNLKEGASGRTSKTIKNKENDFVLWKSYTPKDGKVFWETKLGKGRPGWHIECSVMANSLLGDTLDIHSGGEDLIFPHHENEIAQSEAHSGKKFARFWIHCKFLLVDNKKMSKSLGNFYTLRDLEKMGYNPLAFRMLCLSSNYKNSLNFTFESLQDMTKNYEDINLLVAKLINYFSEVEFEEEFNNVIKKKAEEYLDKVKEALDDNLNTPLAFKQMYEFISYVNSLVSNGKISKKTSEMLLDYFQDYDSIFGIFNFPEKISKDLENKLWIRFNSRKNKDFSISDKIRKEFSDLNYEIGDFSTGFYVIKNN